MLSIASAHGTCLLGGQPDDTALIVDSAPISYAELSLLVQERISQLGETRRLVMIAAGNALEPIVTYLAALEGGHPVLIVSGGDDAASLAHRASMIERFDPDVVALPGARGWMLEERNPGSVHTFHPELAMLASTSGSTGSPKLVRLSYDNLRSNAASIAQYLRLGPDDCAATTLPLQYCYGLSVVNSHLLAGASVMLTERSVTEESFWREASAHSVTSIAGVPYTFEMLEASGFTERSVPSLRYLTQAGGRLAPEMIRRFARLGEERGFELFVMYGQTEATARMAYLPPELVGTGAGTIGRPIPGGRFRIDAGDPAAGDGSEGELVYEGPNVMLGYAETPADFDLGRTVHELRTGDLARRRADGLYEIVGRMSRFVKIFGLRIDLDQMERLLADDGTHVRVANADERLLLFATSDRVARRAQERAATLAGLPTHAISAYTVQQFPRTPSGKLDTSALVRFAALQDRVSETTVLPDAAAEVSPEAIRDILATLLACPHARPDDSFAALGGDSLSYIEVSLALEAVLGRLPRDWPALTARELAATAVEEADAKPTTADPDTSTDGPAAVASWPIRSLFTGVVRLETPAVLRAIAIVLIVGTHADLFVVKGGAHLLLAVAGYNLARFQLASVPGRSRPLLLMHSAAQLAVPAVLWIGSVALLTGQYHLSTTALINNLVPGDGRWNEQWQFWFLEAVLWTIVGLAVVFAVRAVDRIERRSPFGFAMVAFTIALVARFAIAGAHPEYVERYMGPVVVWLIALGWLIARADTTARRVVVSVMAVASSVGFFGDPVREAVVVIGVLALIWVPTVRLPRWMVPAVVALAGASMFIYLTHWQVYPPFEQTAPWLGTLLSLATGVIVWRVYTRGSRRVATAVRSLRSSAMGEAKGAAGPA
ncbi:AMP-binding protein [Mycetocola miduiensis]|uniref:Acyl-CoA synthetase (AMP-forming)/AMP-acid ligase II n=1 Tax=Mycetocola miduiensis TaxID=995034 RepID=A0A1I5CUY9_9MICO|nr:AMP-binding protein [Mycetocola miduiensis]SFN90772.1 Acyl-CoA synthetase (AMP-forming)/AMP-acid ligase II [Mycetocola miduiensis]